MDEELFDDLRRELERFSGGGDGDGVEFLLGQLDDDEARVVRLCAIPHQFAPELLAVLATDIDAERRAEIYEELADLSLVVKGDGGLALEEDAREYLFKQWLESGLEEFKAVSGRLAEYYGSGRAELAGAGQAEVEHMFHLVGASQDAGMDEFERLFVRRLGEYRTGECDYLVASVHEYDPVLTGPNRARLAYHEGSLAVGRGEWEEATKSLSYVAEDWDGDAELRAAAWDKLGTVYAAQRRWGYAIISYQRALQSLELDGGAHPDYRVKHNLAVAYRDSDGGDLERARDLLRESLRISFESNDLFWAAKCLNSLGTLYLRLNDNDLAVNSYERSLGLLTELRDHLGVAQVYNNLGLICLNREDWPDAVTHFTSSLREARRAGDTLTQAHALANLALADLNLGRLDSAEKSLRTAFVKYAEMRRPYLQAVAAWRLVATLVRAGRADAAAEFYAAAKKLFAESNAEREMESLAEEFGRRFEPRAPDGGGPSLSL